MARSDAAPPLAAAPHVTLGPGWGWQHWQRPDGRLSLRGYVFAGSRTLTGADAADHVLARLAPARDDTALARALAELGGHFALVLEQPNRTIATVDRVRSIPLLYGQDRHGVLHIDDRGRRLRDRLQLGPGDIDPDQSLAVAMSGYTIGAATLYRGMSQLRAGEALIVDASGHRALRWFVYDAWRTEQIQDPERRLSDLHRFMIERLAASAGGRTIAVPLSAGLDSRMIASGLKAVGYPHVRTFSYGRAGNHEAETARLIAERLGYPWTFVPFTTRGQRAMFADPEHERAIWQEADTCGGVPFEQDWTAIKALRHSGWLPADCMVVNGQSGDFITGNHAPLKLIDVPAPGSGQAAAAAVGGALLQKHYRLWAALATAGHDATLLPLLLAEAAAAGATFADGEAPHGIYEMIEYQDRQAKYVISGQRTYDALGVDWRLPLWDDEYVLFWRRAEASLKRGQNLYRRVLERDAWGGVWSGIPVNAKTIRPRWIIPLRLAAKAAHAPFGHESWHRFERRVFGWWMDPLRLSAVVPYGRALGETGAPRNAVAWLAERYLAQHGLSLCAMHAGASS